MMSAGLEELGGALEAPPVPTAVKVVCFFEPPAHVETAEDDPALAAQTALAREFGASVRLVRLGQQWEQAVRSEVFLSRRQVRLSLSGAFCGAVLGITLTIILLSPSHHFGVLLAPLLANTVYSAAFAGAGVGCAMGATIAGLSALATQFPVWLEGQTMLTAYVSPRLRKRAQDQLAAMGGRFLD